MASAKYLLSPDGVKVPVSSPAEEVNLRARGYRDFKVSRPAAAKSETKSETK